MNGTRLITRAYFVVVVALFQSQAIDGFTPSHCSGSALGQIACDFGSTIIWDTHLPAQLYSRVRVASSATENEDGEEQSWDQEDWQVSLDENVKLDAMERAWRYVKKPLLSIGSKGATLSHGNSLRQLLEQHALVKVKVNTRRFDDSLHEAFEQLRALAEESGAPLGIELLQARDSEKVILFGMPGTMQQIKDNQFPPQETKKED